MRQVCKRYLYREIYRRVGYYIILSRGSLSCVVTYRGVKYFQRVVITEKKNIFEIEITDVRSLTEEKKMV